MTDQHETTAEAERIELPGRDDIPSQIATETCSNLQNIGLKIDVLALESVHGAAQQAASVVLGRRSVFSAGCPAPTRAHDTEESDYADIGRAFMSAWTANLDHPVLKDWTPAECPSEMIGDLLQMIDDARATRPAPIPSEVVAASEGATPGKWWWHTSNSWLRLGTDAVGRDRNGKPYSQDGYVMFPYTSQHDRHPDLCIRNEKDQELIVLAVNYVRALIAQSRSSDGGAK